MKVTGLTTIQATLDAVGEHYAVLPLQGQAVICVTQRGGRVIGLYPKADGPNLLWTNHQVLADAGAFRSFAAGNNWNLGGERIWIAPEIQYIIQDRRDFWGTHRLPESIDPGHYALKASDQTVHLTQSLTLHAYNLAQGEKHLTVERAFSPIPNPLRTLTAGDDLMAGVQFIGYAQRVTLTEINETPILSESWNLVQLQPGGVLYIPTLGDVESTPYFGDVPEEARTLAAPHHLRLNITGTRQYKVGYKATSMTGRMAYLNTLADGRAYLLVRHFDSNPSATYAEEPPDMPGVHGHSVHVYNDGGGFGGFGEMECSGQAIGGSTGRTTSTDVFRMWAYVGAMSRLKPILYALTGITV
ncbi:MAG: hypothetical protein OHK0046_37090 [Anaerolineae bacterium]